MTFKNLSLVFAGLIFIITFISFTSAITISDVSTTPSSVAPGESLRLTISLENNLEDDAQNINIELDLTNVPIAPFESSSEQSIDEINKDDKESFQFKLIAEPKAASGIYKIPVKISYLLDDQQKQKTGVVSVNINSEPKITIAGEGALVRGREMKVTVQVINNGLSDIKLVSVEAQNPTNAIINPPLYYYIGSINSDDFDSVDYTIKPTSENAKSVLLSLVIKYKDATNKDYSETKTITFPVYTQKDAISRGLITKSRTGTYIGVVVILIIIYIFYRVRKSRKKRAV